MTLDDSLRAKAQAEHYRQLAKARRERAAGAKTEMGRRGYLADAEFFERRSQEIERIE